MSSIERGLRNVSVLNLARIAAALEVPVWDLLGARDRNLTLVGSVERHTAIRPVTPLRQRGDRRVEWKPGHYLSLG